MTAETEIPNWDWAVSLTGYRLVQRMGWCWFMEKEPSPMEMILGEVERALKADLYYVAIAIALTIPDICAALQAEDGRSNHKRYHGWFYSYLAAAYPEITAVDCYSLRCGVVHQGRMGRDGIQYARVLFTVPNVQRNVFHRNIMNDALNLDAVMFCHDIINGARRWYEDHKDDEAVRANLPLLVQYRPRGLAPYMVGMPLIA